MRYVNLGCGSRFHRSWINFDLVSTDQAVIAHDLSRGIPLESESCDAVYHSHVLEHLRRPDAQRLMQESFRVLRPGGVLRVAVPDLERVCRTYLSKLDAATNGDAAAAADYDWVMLELYDQTVRETSGGGMREYLTAPDLRNEAFAYERLGEVAREIVRSVRGEEGPSPAQAARRTLRHLLASPKALAEGLRSVLLRSVVLRMFFGGDAVRAQQIGRFRLAGEVHQWMYDRFSLGRLMARVGFRDLLVQDAVSSKIDNWKSFHLDTLPDGTVIKPDSLFMEGVRPGR